MHIRTVRERHEDDDLLPRGALDPTNPRYVPEELRADFVACPPDVEYQFRKQLHKTGTVTRYVGDTLHQATPADSSEAFETALCWDMIRWAAQQVENRRLQAERGAAAERQYTCPCCERVCPYSPGDRYTKQRRLPDGTTVTCCADCAAVLEQLARDRLASLVLPSGRTRLETATDFYEARR